MITFFRQILDKRRWLLIAGASAILFAAFYLALDLHRIENFAALEGFLTNLKNADFEGFSPIAVFFLLIAATLISEDLACIAAGVLASQGKIPLLPAILACAVGIFIGDAATFLAGRILGRRALKWKITSYFLSEKAVEKSSRWLERQGMKTVFISRFIFGMRLPLYFGAGVLKTSFWRFALYFSLAVAVWTPIVVILTYKIGAQAVKTSFFNQNLWLGLLALVAVFYVLFRYAQQLLTWKGRRLLSGRVQRRFRREFWSLRFIAAPLVVYVAYLMLKHRSLTVFTCANPVLRAGGFLGESKTKILESLSESKASAPFTLKHLYMNVEISSSEKRRRAADFMAANDLSFPIVLKPDRGARGRGVFVIDSPAALDEKLSAGDDQILQEFAAGAEASVFYCRYPTAEKGRLLAITEKRFPFVTGDGATTLEDLILRDKDAVCLAEKYFENNAERLEWVPPEGASVALAELGNHARGALYLDGERLKTKALEDKIDEICRRFEGFYFGRFDVRARSFDDLKQAQNFKIIELNGIATDATRFFDPRFSLLDAYRALFRQWRIAFEIGAENRKRGARSTRFVDLIKLFLGGQIRNPKSEIRN
ncbi:MAG TPA: VTT domain-containing protein [Pyrinomonadaceae bacterium]|jgi:membrane protein DedA with SNARE-associated domain